jgi:hypothetical protein
MGRESRLRSVEPAGEPRPTITATLGALVNAAPVLERLLTARVPAAVAYRLAKLARTVSPEVAHFHQQREALIREYGGEREPTDAERANGATSIFEVGREHLATFTEKLAEVQAVEVAIDAAPLTIEELGHVDVSGSDLLTLGPLVDLDIG